MCSSWRCSAGRCCSGWSSRWSCSRTPGIARTSRSSPSGRTSSRTTGRAPSTVRIPATSPTTRPSTSTCCGPSASPGSWLERRGGARATRPSCSSCRTSWPTSQPPGSSCSSSAGRWGRGRAPWAAALFLFNPAIVLISTIWGQNDPVATAAVLATAWLLATDRLEWAAAAACVAMLSSSSTGSWCRSWASCSSGASSWARPIEPAGWWRVAPRRGSPGCVTTVLICLPFGPAADRPG